jgi:hypothetical protein
MMEFLKYTPLSGIINNLFAKLCVFVASWFEYLSRERDVFDLFQKFDQFTNATLALRRSKSFLNE